MKLTLKQQAFCDHYLACGNATEAARRAGYSAKTARVIGTENLTKPAIRYYLEQRHAAAEKERWLDITKVQNLWGELAADPSVPPAVRVRVTELAARSLGMFNEQRGADSEQVVITDDVPEDKT